LPPIYADPGSPPFDRDVRSCPMTAIALRRNLGQSGWTGWPEPLRCVYELALIRIRRMKLRF
jgi:hypothetical protein